MERDIELDSESMQADIGSTVRKSIPLKLKKPKVKVKSSKSSKSKKEKKSSSTEHKESSEESKAKKSPKKPKPPSSVEPFPKHNKHELDWNQKIMLIGEKVQDPMIHVCETCTLPILVYGRLSACKHVYCLTCAEKSSGQCSRCGERIERIEPVGIGQIFVCSFGGSRHGISGCRRSYLSQRDLLAHIRHRHHKDGIPHSDADAITKRLNEQTLKTASVPYLGAQFIPPNIRPNFTQPLQPRMPVDNRMVQGTMPQGSMPPRDPVFLEGQRMPMMGQFPQTAPGQQFQPVNQSGFHADQTMMQRHYGDASRNAVQNQIAVDQFLASSSVGQFGQPASNRPVSMSMPQNPMQFPTSSGQYLQAGMPQQPTMQQQQATMQQQATLQQQQATLQQQQATMPPPQPHVDASMPPARIEGMQQTMGHAPPVDGSWQGVPQQDWGASQRAPEMTGGYGADNQFTRTF